MSMEVHVLNVGGEFFDAGDNRAFFEALADGLVDAQVVTMIQPCGHERRLYQIKAYLTGCPNASALELERLFGLTAGELITDLLELQRAGLIESVRLGRAAVALA